MSVIVLSSQKGGVGKSTTAILLACEFSKKNTVSLINCDPGNGISIWSKAGQIPENIKIFEETDEDEILDLISDLRNKSDFIIIDLEGSAKEIQTVAISQADLVIVPMQPNSLDAAVGIRSIKVLKRIERVSNRKINSVIAFTQVPTGFISKQQTALVEELQGQIKVLPSSLCKRVAYAELYAQGGRLETLDKSFAGKIKPALENALEFAEAVKNELKK